MRSLFRTAGANTFCFEPKALACVHASPQVLAVTAPIAGVPHLFLCGHAPHSGKSMSIIQAWWSALSALPFLDGFRGRVILLVDANAQLGSIMSDSVGAHAGSPECFAGGCLREFCDAHAVVLPATKHNATGICDSSAREVTWYSPAGHSSRIDYIGVGPALSIRSTPCAPAMSP